ncbi:hypothetical protein KVR01_010309 [Diaporthe batatas]|uniref:uncharacterized protein n=1 Tax=Diaporthe batatas TaxID=748121 RepID=UPI001D048A8B|nr:uncharacterized protein KVR01_010309 [Diaporthe batatas]KAG8159672.1 hypothetical protein KVR01_010309 [Diaporthe batatas]
MQLFKAVMLIAPLLVAASPVELEPRQFTECCFLGNWSPGLQMYFRATGSGTIHGSPDVCLIDVKRDASDPDNCSKVTATFNGGYCFDNSILSQVNCTTVPAS